MVADAAVAVRGALQHGVMDDHQLAIPTDLDVELDGTHAKVAQMAKAGQGVFRGLAAGAAMSDDEHGLRSP